MKRLILTIALCAGFSGTALAQGTIRFDNFTSSVGGRVYVWHAGIVLAPAGTHVELLAGPIGSTNVSQLTSRRIFVSTTGGGQFFDGATVNLAGIPAGAGNSDPTQNVVLALRGWTGNAPDFDSAYQESGAGFT